MFSPLPPLLRNGRTALLLVVVACSTPERARAGCEHPGNIFKTNLLTIGKTPTDPGEVAKTSVPTTPMPCPCQGPNCSGQQDRGTPPTTVVLGVSKVQEATLPNTGTDPADARAAFARDRSSPLPIDGTSAIFHPPRCG